MTLAGEWGDAMRPLLVLPLFVVAALPAFAQQHPLPPVDSTAVIAFRLTDHSKRRGRVVAADDHAVTVLGGYPFASRSFEKKAIVMLGGETRIGRRLKLMTELWKLPQINRVAGIYGVRYLGDEFTVEVGGGAVVDLSLAVHWRRTDYSAGLESRAAAIPHALRSRLAEWSPLTVSASPFISTRLVRRASRNP
jgi:hypothetical protein